MVATKSNLFLTLSSIEGRKFGHFFSWCIPSPHNKYLSHSRESIHIGWMCKSIQKKGRMACLWNYQLCGPWWRGTEMVFVWHLSMKTSKGIELSKSKTWLPELLCRERRKTTGKEPGEYLVTLKVGLEPARGGRTWGSNSDAPTTWAPWEEKSSHAQHRLDGTGQVQADENRCAARRSQEDFLSLSLPRKV